MTDQDAVEFDLEPTDQDLLALVHEVHGEGRYIRRMASSPAYGHLRVVLSPYRGERGYRFQWSVPEGVLPLAFMRSASLGGIKDALRTPLEGGGRAAYIQVSVVDGSYHETDTHETAVRIAASMAVTDALSRAQLIRE